MAIISTNQLHTGTGTYDIECELHLMEWGMEQWNSEIVELTNDPLPLLQYYMYMLIHVCFVYQWALNIDSICTRSCMFNYMQLSRKDSTEQTSTNYLDEQDSMNYGNVSFITHTLWITSQFIYVMQSHTKVKLTSVFGPNLKQHVSRV